ncbi:MAG: hypothetical protein Q4B28_06935 [bacterium]|nr:hypothetical protein [bacterium]
MAKKRKPKQTIKRAENSFGGGLSNLLLFSGTPSIENLINAQDYGRDTAYVVTYALVNKNVVVSRFVQFVADAMTGITLMDKNGDEILTGI